MTGQKLRPRRIRQTRLAVGTAAALVLTGCSAGGSDSADGSSISILIDNQEATVTTMNALVAAYQEENPDVTIEVETRPQGSEGDNVVKTRLATDEMNDLFWYNSGSLLKALNPDQTLIDLSDEEWAGKVDENATLALSGDEGLYGVPVGQSMAGAMFYNKDIYSDLGLSVPTTWDEFVANAEAVKAAGTAAPIIQTYGDTWTSQLFLLGDFANVLAEDPEWAEDYTANNAKYVDEPAFSGFEHLEQLSKAGLFNEDFASATYDDGIRMVATGEGAHYPILSFAAQPLELNYADQADSVGLFAIPGDGPESPLTVWEPFGVYIPTSTEGAQLDTAKDFAAWLATPESCDIQSKTTAPQGPYVIEGCTLPEDVPTVISDMQPYFDSGNTGLALEFLSPIKGPALEQITVAVGSGITPAAEGAQQYDDDVTKQAQQLGLEGW